jgi:Fe2+ transport system protein FeoA
LLQCNSVLIIKVVSANAVQYNLFEKGENMKTLDLFDVGEVGVVKSVGGEGKIKRRLFDMGITPGAQIRLRKKAPLGDPIEITVRGYELTLRKTEAVCVTMEEQK